MKPKLTQLKIDLKKVIQNANAYGLVEETKKLENQINSFSELDYKIFLNTIQQIFSANV